jgi:N utilization substance protein A
MSTQFAEAFNDLVREKRIEKEVLLETLKAGFSSAVKKKHGATAEVDVIEDARGNLKLYLLKTVVEEIEDPSIEMTLDEAKGIRKSAKMGDTMKIAVPFAEFGRNAIQIAKQILMQKIREFERDRTFDEYEGRVGEIVSGSVQQIDRGGILVNLGNAEATMPKKEQIRRERYSQGASIRACIIKVDKEAKGPMVVLSRTSPDFLKKLFAQEVPEIYEGIIEIKSVAREAGGRSKIAVYSRDDRVDAVGACVGMKGSRVQAVVNELSGERIDIVPWSDDIMAFVSRALSPAKISNVRTDHEERTVLVIVEDDQLSLAIGKDGQNVRLASKLTEWQIDLITSRELEQRERLEDHLTMSIDDMLGVTDKMAERLRGAGITTVQKLSRASNEELLEIPGLGPKTVETLRETADATIEELEKALKELIEKENAERETKEEKPLFDEAVLEGGGDDDSSDAAGGESAEATAEPKPKLTEEALFGDVAEEVVAEEVVEEAADKDAIAEEATAEDATDAAVEEVAEAPETPAEAAEPETAVEDTAVGDVAEAEVAEETAVEEAAEEAALEAETAEETAPDTAKAEDAEEASSDDEAAAPEKDDERIRE